MCAREQHTPPKQAAGLPKRVAGRTATTEVLQYVVLHEVDALALVRRRQAPATAAAHHARAGHAHAGWRAGPQDGVAFQRGNCFAAQQTRQLNPLRASNARTAFDQFRRHWPHRIPHRPAWQSGIPPLSPGPWYWSARSVGPWNTQRVTGVLHTVQARRVAVRHAHCRLRSRARKDRRTR